MRHLLVAFLGLALFASVTLVAGSQQPASAQTDLDTTMLLFDLSGSMGSLEPDGRTRLAVAQQAMIDAIGGLEPGSRNIGIRTFSDCGVTTLEQAPTPTDLASLSATINSFTPDAGTDIALALSAVGDDFDTSSGRKTVILLSDGEDTCLGDPCQTATDLINAGVDIVVNAIGIGTAGTTAEAELACIAGVTGGTVVSVASAEEIFSAIDDALDDDDDATSAFIEYRVPTCINSTLVQNDPALAATALGYPFRDSGGVQRVLVSGESCNFDCSGGFDINCDGELGDFCNSDFDRTTVRGVGQCLEQLGEDANGESIAEIAMLEANCLDNLESASARASQPVELTAACNNYRTAKTFQRRADDARSNSDAAHRDYNQILADAAFAKAQVEVDTICATEPSDAPTERAALFGWSMNYRVSGNDGLVLTDIFLGDGDTVNRKMAERVSIPYLSVRPLDGPEARVELMASPLLGDCPGATSRSRLVSSDAYQLGGEPTLRVEAVYQIDQIAGLAGILTVTQRYEFDAELPGGRCEPTADAPAPDVVIDKRVLPCNPFRFTVDYAYNGTDGFGSIEIPQRLHFTVDDRPNNTGVAFMDRNTFPETVAALGNPVRTFPITSEQILPALVNGLREADPLTTFVNQSTTGPAFIGDQTTIDNYHQTFRDAVRPPQGFPIAKPGCPECVHMHWRWSNLIRQSQYGQGRPLIPAGSTQDLAIGFSNYRSSEMDPMHYEDVIGNAPIAELVTWYISTARDTSDTFFAHPGRGGDLPARGGAFFSIGYIDFEAELDVESGPIGVNVPIPVSASVRNNGPGTATNALVVFEALEGRIVGDTFPPNCERASASAVKCSYDEFAVNASRSFEFEVLRPDTPGPLQIVITTKADQVDFDEDTAKDSVIVNANVVADLALTGSVTERDDEVVYRLSVLNTLPGEARDVVLVVQLPDGVDPASVEAVSMNPQAGECSANISRATVTCEWEPFSGGQVAFITVPAGQPEEPLVASVSSADGEASSVLELALG